MTKEFTQEQLMIPIYVNEKIVLDMLAIMENGFSKVSQVNLSEHTDHSSDKSMEASGKASIFDKLFNIQLNGDIANSHEQEENRNITNERVHTNTSLLSKFRTMLVDDDILQTSQDISEINVGSFIEIEGELQKNPLIDYMERVSNMFRLADIFSDPPALGNKKNGSVVQNQKLAKQINDFISELTNSGTVYFVLTCTSGQIVISTQEQYLTNDNISEILGGTFKVLGKVTSVCKNNSDTIDLLRKTALSVFTDETIETMLKGFKDLPEEQFDLPKLVTKIESPAAIVIPIAIYV